MPMVAHSCCLVPVGPYWTSQTSYAATHSLGATWLLTAKQGVMGHAKALQYYRSVAKLSNNEAMGCSIWVPGWVDVYGHGSWNEEDLKTLKTTDGIGRDRAKVHSPTAQRLALLLKLGWCRWLVADGDKKERIFRCRRDGSCLRSSSGSLCCSQAEGTAHLCSLRSQSTRCCPMATPCLSPCLCPRQVV